MVSRKEQTPQLGKLGRIPKTEFRGPEGTGLLTPGGVLTRESESFGANCPSAEAIRWVPGVRAKSESAGNSEKHSKTGRKNAKSRERKLSARCVNFCVALFVDEIRTPFEGPLRNNTLFGKSPKSLQHNLLPIPSPFRSPSAVATLFVNNGAS